MSGVPVAQPVVVAHGGQVRQGPPPRKQQSNCGKNILFMIVALLICGGIGVGVYFYLQSNPIGGSNSSTAGSIPTFAPTCTDCTRAPTAPTPPPNVAFNIQLVYRSATTPAQQELFELARIRLEQVITADTVSETVFDSSIEICAQDPFRFTSDYTVDDVVILVDLSTIDGPGGTLGRAGPCRVKSDFVVAGSMEFDSADIDDLISGGTAQAVILHEMLHVLGLGTLWEKTQGFDLINPDDSVANPVAPFTYTGANGNEGHVNIGGSGSAIVEDDYGPGTARGHWKENIYDSELMTGFIESNNAPMSMMTIKSLKDLGFTVDESQAQTYTVPSGRRLREDRSMKQGANMHGDIYQRRIIRMED